MSAGTEKRLLVIAGPTAAGKTALAVELALRLGGEVISADSMQIYRGMDIGTAKATAEELRGVPHHLLDVAEPEESYSVARWAETAEAAALDIFARGRLPIVAGGTGQYIDALLYPRDFASSGDGALRARLGAEYDRMGGAAFRERLRMIDPARAEKLSPADKKRLVRAMEVYLLTGETISAHDARTKALPPRFDSLRVALSFADRAVLYARIDRRVDEMLRRGLLEETAALLARGVQAESTAMQAIGYRECAACLRTGGDLEETAAQIRQASRRYAKRQLTWLRRDGGLHWILWQDAPDIPHAADEVCALWNRAPDGA